MKNKTINTNIDADEPLRIGNAIKSDKLGREEFSRSAVRALQRVTNSTGFSLSIEGTWGSGKTSVLAMIAELLEREKSPPVIAHFNPWLVGDREALLRQFLAKLTAALNQTDHAKEGKRVARELKSYARAFDVVKLIPGAEPWASIIKSVLESVGDATNSISEYKTPDIEIQKNKVEDALRKFHRPIIVFIDDIDRLFPSEVYEMVRIIKAVGDLPNIGYVLAWDPDYVSQALENSSIPHPNRYLDKIVQVRMQLPILALHARSTLINDAIKQLNPEALHDHFPDSQDRFSYVYLFGLRDVLEQPRDISRVFNTVSVIEPSLRGELVLADIIGLAALIVKAPAVYEIMKRNPRWFVGNFPGEFSLSERNETILEEGKENRQEAYSKCPSPEAIQNLIHCLFPLVAEVEGGTSLTRTSDVEGHIASPKRLAVALQLSTSPSDVSFVATRKYLFHPEQRYHIENSLTTENCLDFLGSLGELTSSLEGNGICDIEELCLAIARLVDKESFPSPTRGRNSVFFVPADDVAVQTINSLVKTINRSLGPSIADLISNDPLSLTVASRIFIETYSQRRKLENIPVSFSLKEKGKYLKEISKNTLAAAKDNSLMRRGNPGLIIWNLGREKSPFCPLIFEAIRANDPTLDKFVLEILKNSFDSTKGQAYALPSDISILESYCPLHNFREHAKDRLNDLSLQFPTRAAWKSVVENRPLYGEDGTTVSR